LSKRAFSTLRILPFSGRIAWKRPVAALLGRAAGGVALDEKSSDWDRVLFLAVGELAGQAGDIQHTLAAGHFPRLARCLPRARGLEHLVGDDLGLTLDSPRGT
jgi:hypothetical protein